MTSRGRRMAAFGVAAALVAGAAGVTAQTVRLQQLMRAKLGHAEALLEAVVTSDWDEIEIRGLALEDITRASEWAVLPSQEYAERSEAFREAVQELVTAARARDLDAAATAYVNTTLSCVACHRDIALARQAR